MNPTTLTLRQACSHMSYRQRFHTINGHGFLLGNMYIYIYIFVRDCTTLAQGPLC